MSAIQNNPPLSSAEGILPTEPTLEEQVSELMNENFFGSKDWEKYFGIIGNVSILPIDILETLNSKCPLMLQGSQNDSIIGSLKDTHILFFMPDSINGQALTLNRLLEHIQKPKEGHPTTFLDYEGHVKDEIGDATAPRGHWVLMTREVMPGSRNLYQKQLDQVEKINQEVGLSYEIPMGLEVATGILTHYVKTGERLFSDAPWMVTRTQELVNNNQWPMTIGGFSEAGLRVSCDQIDTSYEVTDSCMAYTLKI